MSQIIRNIRLYQKYSTFRRALTTKCRSLQFADYGEPADVIKIVEESLDLSPKKSEVLVKILAAPVNPADINTIQGKYPVKPTFPAIGGNEFAGEIIEKSSDVTDFEIGDRVIPNRTGLGAWRSLAVFNKNDLIKIPSYINVAEAATLTVNPCTAYRMLKDFTPVSGEKLSTVIQNGANSAVGQAVHQLCKAWKIPSVGIVRNRPDVIELKKYLLELGATAVLTEDEARSTKIFTEHSDLTKPQLALNCIGGRNGLLLTRQLSDGGTMVTYGGMSREPVTVATSSLIFNDIQLKGFWMTRWTKRNRNTKEQQDMFANLCQLIKEKKFIAPAHELVTIDNYKEILGGALAMGKFSTKKFIFNFQNE